MTMRRRTFKELVREIDCPQCNRKYATRSSLATHMRLKHAMELEPLRMCTYYHPYVDCRHSSYVSL